MVPNEAFTNSPSRPETPAPKVSWFPVLLDEIERDVEPGFVLGARLDFRLFDGPEVAELVDALDGRLEQFHVHDVLLVQPHLAPDHPVLGGRVPPEFDPVHEELVLLGEIHHHIHHPLLGPAVPGVGKPVNCT